MTDLFLTSTLLDQLIQVDVQFFNWINHDLQNGFLDNLMPWWREKKTWIPLYIGLAAFLLYRYRLRGFYYIILVALTVGLADTVSSRILKPAVARERPCQTTPFKDTVSLKVDHCGIKPSFTSSHASNHFALASLWVFTLPFLGRFGKWALWFWAGSIAFGQVYVGVHYPLDVICGALLGLLIGWGGAVLYRKLPSRFRLED